MYLVVIVKGVGTLQVPVSACKCELSCAGDVDVDELSKDLPPREKFPNFRMVPAEFEKVCREQGYCCFSSPLSKSFCSFSFQSN